MRLSIYPNPFLLRLIPLVAIITGASVNAEDRNWNPAVISGNWNSGTSWTEGSAPLDGQSASTEVGNVNFNIDIDNGGANVNLPNSDLRFGRGTLFDSSGNDDSIIADTVAFNGAGGAAITVNVPVIANLYTTNRHGAIFNAPTTIDTFNLGGQHQIRTTFEVSPTNTITLITLAGTDNSPTDHDDNLTINANLSATTFQQTHGGLTVGPGATFTVGNWQYVQGDITNNGTIVGTTPASLPAFQTWIAGADGSIPNNPISIEENARMSIGAAQTGTWNNSNLITVMSGAVLDGNLTNAVFTAGPGQNIAIHGGAIYAPSAGDTLTQGDIVGGGTVIGGALHLRNNNEFYLVKGDAAPGPVRGIAIGPFTEFWNNGRVRGTFELENNTGDMLVVMKQNAIARGLSGDRFDMLGNATSTTANIIASGGRLHWEGVNQQAIANNLANPITTFNFQNGLTSENNEVLRLARWRSDAAVDASQTINITGGRATVVMSNNLGANMAGTLIIGDGGGLRLEGSENFSSPTAQIEFRSGSALFITDFNNYDVFEGLAPGQITVEANPAVAPIIHTNDEDITINNTMTNFLKVLEGSNFVVQKNNNRTYTFDGTAGLPVGDGRYFMQRPGSNNTLAAETTYFGISNAGNESMGIAAFSGNTLTIDAPTQAPGATLMIGSDTPLTAVLNNGNFERHTAIPDGTVRFLKAITAETVDVRSGTMRNSIDQTLNNLNIGAGASVTMDNNVGLTVNGAFGGNGDYLGGDGITVTSTGSLNPGESIGTITGNTLLLEGGATYNWEVAAPTGTPGTDWDLSVSDTLNVPGTLNFNIIEFGLTADVLATDSFIVAAANSIDNFDPSDVVFDVIADEYSWNIASASLSEEQGTGAFAGQEVLVLTGVTAQFGAAAVPEPASIAIWSLIGLSLAGFGYYRGRRKK